MANFTSNPQIPGYTLIRFVFCLFLFVVCIQGLAQPKLSSTNKKALKLYEKGQAKAKERDFETALSFFTSAIKNDPAFFEAYLRRGSLYNAMGMEDSVYANLGSYLTLVPAPNPTILNRMATLSFNRGAYSKSRQYLDKLFEIVPEAREQQEMDLLDRSLDFAQNEIAKDAKVEIELLPEQVNRFSLQYLPTITIDNSTLVFTKRDRIEGDEDIVVSFFKNGEWSVAHSISSQINTPLNEGACSISADGKVMIFTSCDRRASLGSCDLYITRKIGNDWSKPRNLGEPINSQYWESQPSLSADGKRIYFSSNRPGGNGGRDLWTSSYVGSKWSQPQNLGKKINSFKDETTPFIHPNGETIYFSSNGHVGMGGFDLMRSNYEDSIWSTPLNLGYPINSYNDEVALLIGGDGKTAYFAQETQRDNRITDSKIVSFDLPETYWAKPATYVVGRTLDNETDEPIKAKIEVVDLDLNLFLYQAESDSLTGEYTMVLPSDKDLAYYVKKKGYFFFENNYYSKSNTILEPDTIDIRLRPIAVDETLILQNIYFELDSYELNKKSKSELSNVVEILKENPQIIVEIGGHTDSSGSPDYNHELSEKRAEEVYKEILKQQIETTRLSFKGYGDKFPVQSNDTEEGRQSNRRIEFRVLRIIH